MLRVCLTPGAKSLLQVIASSVALRLVMLEAMTYGLSSPCAAPQMPGKAVLCVPLRAMQRRVVAHERVTRRLALQPFCASGVMLSALPGS